MPSGQWYEDFAAFTQHLGVSAQKGSITTLPGHHAPTLSVGWIPDDLRHLETQLPPAR